MTEEIDLAELDRLLAAASPRPWLVFDRRMEPERIGDDWDLVDDPDWTITTDCVPVSRMSTAAQDYPLIVAAVNVLPDLLARVRAAEARVKHLEAENAVGITQAIASVVTRDLTADDKARIAAFDAAARAALDGITTIQEETSITPECEVCSLCGWGINHHDPMCSHAALAALLEDA